ncbi:STAS/SEC14 domain-containing protein [Flavobacterium circumlabens]|uniref:STAS/SEC14 domain-containing protein n=1 Tax=Flavobacterium circumlabens TaxID=2133765 RepID=A0A4Y7U9G6_9FLAO|nr:STAS/SEC14 domain-containing protein [Flavobacterium circumlabens]TCN54722.1 SpoIIAA-like protein [Flavobacterium circumlabens]TEB42914.1 STAS/SEC14 domain-containing protein [Flavobacterium circumlabens]
MIQLIQDSPNNIAAFRATGEVTQEHFQNIIIPEVDRVIQQVKHINFLLVLDTELENFTTGAWVQDAMLGLKNIGKWNRAAIVTDSDTIISFTNGFSYLIPGEFKGFKKEQYDEALTWVSEETL